MSGRMYRQVRASGVVDDDGIFPRPSGGRRPRAVVPLKRVLGDAMLQRLVEAFARSLWRDYENATVRIARVPMRDATPVAISVDKHRLGQAGELLWKYRLAKAKPYEPVLVQDPSATSWRLLLPPIIEAHGDDRTGPKAMYVLDGMHRLHNLYQWAVSQAVALIISSPHLPPPAARTPDSWKGVWRAEAGTPGGEARFCWLSESLLRPVAEKIDRQEWELSTDRGEQVFPTQFRSVDDCARRAKQILGRG